MREERHLDAHTTLVNGANNVSAVREGWKNCEYIDFTRYYVQRVAMRGKHAENKQIRRCLDDEAVKCHRIRDLSRRKL